MDVVYLTIPLDPVETLLSMGTHEALARPINDRATSWETTNIIGPKYGICFGLAKKSLSCGLYGIRH